MTLKYLLLAPAEAFREVAEEARSVVLAGGTMAPMGDFREQLFPYLEGERFSTFSCGHVVPDENVATFAVAKGPGGRRFEFTYEARADERLVSGLLKDGTGGCELVADVGSSGVQHDELGQAIINICQVVPKGVVVFCPSYEFLWQVKARWEKAGALDRLEKRKKVSRRPLTSARATLAARCRGADAPCGPGLAGVLGAQAERRGGPDPEGLRRRQRPGGQGGSERVC